MENILLDCDGHVILTDFGLSKEFLPHEKVCVCVLACVRACVRVRVRVCGERGVGRVIGEGERQQRNLKRGERVTKGVISYGRSDCREHGDFDSNSPSRMQNGGIPMPHLFGWGALGVMTSHVRLYL